MAQVSVAQIQYLLGITAMGQAAMAGSLPVVLASNQTAIPVTVPVGQQAMAASTPVVVASNQSSLPTTEARLPTALGAQTAAASLSVVQASSHQFLIKLVDTAGTNVGTIKAASTPAAATDTAVVVSLAGANSATKIGDGTNNAAVKAASTAPAAADPALVVSISPNSLVNTTGGATSARVLAAATTNGTVVKASAGQVYGWYFYNSATSTKFVKLYNSTTVTAGSGTPIITIPVPAGGGTNVFWGSGVVFATGICYTITGVITDADTTAVAANDISGWLLYK